MTQTVNVRKVIEIDVKASKDAADAVKKMASQMGSIEEHAKKGSGAISQMFGLMRAGVHLFVFSEIAQMVKDVVLAINSLNDKASITVKRFEQITGSTVEARKAFNDIVDVSIRQGQAFDGVAKLYEKATRNAQAWGITMEGARQITDGFSASLRLSGASTQESYAALVQFGQVLASGRFQGDEFRSMMENNATFMYELATATGKTVGELRKLGTDGKLGPEFLREAMFRLGDDGLNMLQRLAKEAGELPMTFGQAMNGAKTAFIDFAEALQGTAEKTEGFMTSITRSFTEWLREKSTQIRLSNEIRAEVQRLLDGADGKMPDKKKSQDEIAADFLTGEMQKNSAIVKQKSARINEMASTEVGKASLEMTEAQRDLKVASIAYDEAFKKLNEIWERMSVRTQRATIPDWTPQKGSGTEKKESTKTDPLAQLKDQLAAYQSDYARMFADPLDAVSGRMSKFHEWLAKRPEIAVLKEAKPFVDAIESMIAAMDQADGAARAVEKGLEFMKNEIQEDIKAVNGLDKLLSKLAKDDPLGKFRVQIDEIDNAMLLTQDNNKLTQLAEGRAELVDKLWKAVREGTKEAGDEAETTAKRIEKAFDKAAGSMSDALVDFVMGTKSSFGDLAVSILADFAKAEARILLSPIMKMASIGLHDWVGSLFPDTSQLPTGNFARADRALYNAKGNAFNGGVHAFAKGGIVDQPMFFSYSGGLGVAGEAGTEVVAPLKRGRDGEMGVAAVAPVVQIINNSRAQIRTEEGEAPDGGKQLRVFVEDAIDTAFGSGRFDRTLSTLYGVGRKGR